jgi:hypothetical protein
MAGASKANPVERALHACAKNYDVHNYVQVRCGKLIPMRRWYCVALKHRGRISPLVLKKDYSLSGTSDLLASLFQNILIPTPKKSR